MIKSIDKTVTYEIRKFPGDKLATIEGYPNSISDMIIIDLYANLTEDMSLVSKSSVDKMVDIVKEMPVLKPLYIRKIDTFDCYILVTPDGVPICIQSKYYEYFCGRYSCEFRGMCTDEPVGVITPPSSPGILNEVVGLIMPLDITPDIMERLVE